MKKPSIYQTTKQNKKLTKTIKKEKKENTVDLTLIAIDHYINVNAAS